MEHRYARIAGAGARLPTRPDREAVRLQRSLPFTGLGLIPFVDSGEFGNRRSRVLAPAQEQTDVAGLTVRKIKHLSREIESERSQRRVPQRVNVGCFAAQSLGPCGIWRIVDRARIVRASIA